MSETDTLRKAAEIMRGLGQSSTGTVVRELKDVADRLGRARDLEALRRMGEEADRRDVALARVIAGTAQYPGSVHVGWSERGDDDRSVWIAAARAAREHTTAEQYAPGGGVTPDAEPERTPTPGQWAQIKPGADRGRVPEGVDRVLVLLATRMSCQVAWSGPVEWGRAPITTVSTDSLAPVAPRAWQRAEDVPVHVVVREFDGEIARRDEHYGRILGAYGPYTEVMEGEE